MKICASFMIAAVLLVSSPATAQTGNSITLHKAYKGVLLQLNLGRLPMINLIMAFTEDGRFFTTVI